jgi:class 3 adenylate cyclase/tetratricopeptide (TPR) repeat protein
VTCTTCGAENRDGARFCDSCGAALAVAPPREQRKLVTMLFCDVSGSTAFAESRDPEAVRAVMGRYFEVARAAIERHGGTVEKFIGDAVMAVFGVPTIREDDALRAVRAAQELRDAVDVPVRIGVNTGEVVTGTGDSLVTGDAVNVAARLEQAAGAGEVLLGAQTYALVRDAVDVDLLPPLEAKGKTEPLTVYRLRAVTGDTAVARRQDAPFVGRERERALLAGAWARCVSERACALFTILGSAGVGKSRLSGEFLDGVEATVVRGRCLSYGDGITYWPVVEVVKQLLGDDPPPNAAIAALLGEGMASADDIAVALRKLFEAAASERALVVVLDDLQWGEPTFFDLVEHIADWSREAPILLLCLARPDLLDIRSGWAGGKLNATTVLLEPLSPTETDELIDGLLGGADLSADMRDRIREASDGNPLFVEQMLAMLEESPGEVTVPTSIQALLAARLDQLSPPERAALERGAVEGQVFHRGAVIALAPDDPEVPLRLLGLVRKELVRPSVATLPDEEAFRFRHLLIRDAAYDALPKSERSVLHERFAEWLEEHGSQLVELDEILGYHLEQAARYRVELGLEVRELEARAAAHLGAAGERAAGRGDAHAAESLLSRAIALLPPGRDRGILLGRLGYAYEVLARFDDAEAVLDEAIATGGDDAAAFAYFIKVIVRSYVDFDAVTEEREVSARLDTITGSASDLTLAAGHATLALVQFWLGRLEDSHGNAMLALEHSRRAEDQDYERKALVLLANAMMLGSTPWPEVEEFIVELLELGLPGRGWYAAAAAAQGRFDEARAANREVRRNLLEQGARVRALANAIGSGWFELLAGEEEEALALLREAWLGLGELGEKGYRSTIGALLADVLSRSGNADDAEAVLREVDAIASPADFFTVATADGARAMAASCRGDHDRAIEFAREAVAVADAHEYLTLRHDAWMELGEVLLAADRHEEARDALLHSRELAAQKGTTAVVDRVDALLRTAATP